VVAAGALCVLFGSAFVVTSIRPHRGSEAGSLSGGSRAFVQLLGIGTGVWLIAMAIALFGHDPGAVLAIVVAFSVLYIVVGVLFVLAALAGGPGRLHAGHRR
jgi:hypothetical protein